jgi:HEPN domain-containing protein
MIFVFIIRSKPPRRFLKVILSKSCILAPKTHDLDKLLDLCKSYDISFVDIDQQVFELNGMDVRFRYPGPDLMPSDLDVQEALNWSKEVLDFVKARCI